MVSSYDDAIEKAVKDTRLHNAWFPIITLINVVHANKEVELTLCQANKALVRIFSQSRLQNNMGTSKDLPDKRGSKRYCRFGGWGPWKGICTVLHSFPFFLARKTKEKEKSSISMSAPSNRSILGTA
jgi:hypothetical protein